MTNRQKAERVYAKAHKEMEKAFDKYLRVHATPSPECDELKRIYRSAADTCWQAKSNLLSEEIKEMPYYPRW